MNQEKPSLRSQTDRPLPISEEEYNKLAKLLGLLIINDKNAKDYEKAAVKELFEELQARAKNNKFNSDIELVEIESKISEIQNKGEER